MYRHNALSIKETNEKMFVTSEEKKHISDIPNIKEDVTVLKKLSDEKEVMYEELQGSYITATDTRDGSLTDLEILGNTVQDGTDFSNVKFVGKEREDGNYEIKLTSCGKNLINNKFIKGNCMVNNVDPARCHLPTYIKVKKYTDYYITVPDDYRLMAVAVDENNFYDQINLTTSYSKSHTFNTGEYDLINIQGMRADGATIDLDLFNTLEIQMNEGKVATNYEVFKENSCDIVIPFQLKKVDNLTDRLFRREDGVWCIEKNIGEAVLDDTIPYTDMNSNDVWQKPNTSKYVVMNYFKFLPTNTTEINCVSILALQVSYQDIMEKDVEGVGVCNRDGNFLNIAISKTKIGELSIKEYLKINPIKFWYKQTPEIIELPLDTQIQLNSFFGTTNVYMESGEVDGTIKCKVTKSLGGSINSLNKKTDILSDRLETIETLQEGNNLTISTDKGYVVCKDTRNGYIKDIKIEGNTLQNVLPRGFNSYTTKPASITVESGKVTIVGNGAYPSLYYDYSLFKPNTTYTFIVNVLKLNILNTGQDWCIFRIGETVHLPNPTTTGLYVVKFTTPDVEKILDAQTFFRPALTDQHSVEMENLLILEGDYTNNPPEYFEGIASVGSNEDKLEIISKGSNLFNIHDISNTGNATSCVKNGEGVTVTAIQNIMWTYHKYTSIKFNPNTTYTISGRMTNKEGVKIRIYDFDRNREVISIADGEVKQFTTPSTTKNIFVLLYVGYNYTSNIGDSAEFWDVMIQENIEYLPTYINYVEDKKQILYKNSNGIYEKPILRGIPNGIKDSIEKHSDGKYYYHKRCGEVVLNGSEKWLLHSSNTNTNVTSYYCDTYKETKRNNGKFVCDKFKEVSKLGAEEGMDTISQYLCYINIGVDKVPTRDISGFTSWLKDNNVTLVYNLKNEEVYECNSIELNSYDDETLLYIDTGVISPFNLEFKTTSHIGNIISAMKEEVDKNAKFREEMTESVTLTKEFSNGCTLIEDTKEGIVSIDKIEGNTLVNLMKNYEKIGPGYSYDNITKKLSCPSNGSDTRRFEYIESLFDMETDVDYTFIYYVESDNTVVQIGTNENDVGVMTMYPVGNCVNIKQFKSKGRVFKLKLYDKNGTTMKSISNVLLLRGTYSDEDCMKYFEGLKSVGDLEDNITISSTNTIIMEQGTIASIDGLPAHDSKRIRSRDFIPVGYDNTIGLKNVDFSKYEIVFFGYSSNYRLLQALSGKWYSEIPSFTSQVSYYKFAIRNKDESVISVDTFKDPIYDINTFFTSKQLVYKNSNGVYEKPILRSISDSVRDTIEKHSDGKYYYHKRCGEIVLDDSSEWLKSNNANAEWDSTNTVSFYTFPYSTKTYTKSNEVNIITDKFNSYTRDYLAASVDIEGIMANDPITIRIKRSRLQTEDIEGFKKWVKDNPITAVYRLVKEEIYECNNMDLDSYEKETQIVMNTAIPTSVKLSAKSNILDTIDSLKKRIKYLETEFGDMTENGSGWCKLPNGMIMQWGKTAYTPAGTIVEVPFPITFKNVLNVQISGTYNYSPAHYWVIGSVKKTGFAAYKNGSTTTSDDIYWMSIGEV